MLLSSAMGTRVFTSEYSFCWVAASATPVSGRLLYRWKAFTAVWVFSPNTPSAASRR